MVSDAQVRKLMKEINKHGRVGRASLAAGIDRKTARKYIDEKRLPSEMKPERTWRTRDDPFAQVWSGIEEMLDDAPELEAKALFEHLMVTTGRFHQGQVRTFQRRVHMWRALQGPDKEVFFPQQHRPGEAAQTDFTWATELGITIAGEAFEHMLCVVALPYSNWTWATVCRSESLSALKHGIQEAFFRLGRRPEWHQTDNSTAATHNVPSGKRKFNPEYERLMKHLGMKPRTIAIGKSNQNGDVEALNGALKRRLKQHLLLRASSNFDTVVAYQKWLDGVLMAANDLRQKRLDDEIKAMVPLSVKRLPAWTEEKIQVTSWSTIRVKHNAYSVPARLIGEKVRVRLYDDRVEVYFGGALQLEAERALGRNGHRINYRHIIWWLVRKPGAFPRYRYREDLFPTLLFRQAYDVLCECRSARSADIEYLRVLHLAASTMETEVDAALECLLDEGQVPDFDSVKALVQPDRPETPMLNDIEPDLRSFDALLQGVM